MRNNSYTQISTQNLHCTKKICTYWSQSPYITISNFNIPKRYKITSVIILVMKLNIQEGAKREKWYQRNISKSA